MVYDHVFKTRKDLVFLAADDLPHKFPHFSMALGWSHGNFGTSFPSFGRPSPTKWPRITSAWSRRDCLIVKAINPINVVTPPRNRKISEHLYIYLLCIYIYIYRLRYMNTKNIYTYLNIWIIYIYMLEYINNIYKCLNIWIQKIYIHT